MLLISIMRLTLPFLSAAFVVVVAASPGAFAQTHDEVRLHLTDGNIWQVEDAWEDAQGVWFKRGGFAQLMDRARVKKIERVAAGEAVKSSKTEPAAEAKEEAKALVPEQEHPVWIHLVGGTRVEVDEATESLDGVWYRRGKVSSFIERARVERVEIVDTTKLTAATPEAPGSTGGWRLSDSIKVEEFFIAKFGRRLPVTAAGQSGLHTRWGFDHRQSLDVGLHPDSTRGRALLKFLRDAGIPFIAFRSAVPGAATGPHIHIGRPSHRIGAR